MACGQVSGPRDDGGVEVAVVWRCTASEDGFVRRRAQRPRVNMHDGNRRMNLKSEHRQPHVSSGGIEGDVHKPRQLI